MTRTHLCVEAHDGNEPLGVCEICGAERPFLNDSAVGVCVSDEELAEERALLSPEERAALDALPKAEE